MGGSASRSPVIEDGSSATGSMGSSVSKVEGNDTGTSLGRRAFDLVLCINIIQLAMTNIASITFVTTVRVHNFF